MKHGCSLQSFPSLYLIKICLNCLRAFAFELNCLCGFVPPSLLAAATHFRDFLKKKLINFWRLIAFANTWYWLLTDACRLNLRPGTVLRCYGMVWTCSTLWRKFCALLSPPHSMALPFAEWCAKISIAVLTQCRMSMRWIFPCRRKTRAVCFEQTPKHLPYQLYKLSRVSARANVDKFARSLHSMFIGWVHKLDECPASLVAFNCLIVPSQTCEWYWMCKRSRRSSTVSMREQVTSRDECVAVCVRAIFIRKQNSCPWLRFIFGMWWGERMCMACMHCWLS